MVAIAKDVTEEKEKECGCTFCFLKAAVIRYKKLFYKHPTLTTSIAQLFKPGVPFSEYEYGHELRDVGIFGAEWFLVQRNDLGLPPRLPPELIMLLAEAFGQALMTVVAEEIREKDNEG